MEDQANIMETSTDAAEPTMQPESQNGEFQSTNVTLVSIIHAVHDTYTAFVAPLLPILIENLSISKTMAGSFTLFVQFPSILQPVIGHISDRVNLKNLAIFTPAITGILLSLIGVYPSYVFIAVLLLLAGLSSASLHAVGPVIAGNFSGNRLGRGMSFWMVGGEVGRVLGPIVIVSAVGWLSYEGIPWLMIGGIAASIILYFRLKDVDTFQNGNGKNQSFWKALKEMRSMIIPLAIVVGARGFMSSVLTTYLPTFLTDEGANLWFAGVSLSVLEAAGVVGALLAGSISDRIGRRLVLVISLVISPIFMLLFLWTSDWVQIPVLMALGFASISTTPVVMAIVQESFPESRAMANGIYMALGFILRSIMVIIIGLIGDSVGLRMAFYISIVVMLIGVPFVYMLPKRKTVPEQA